MHDAVEETPMSDLEQVLDGLGSPRLLVLGDAMLDRYLWGEAERVSPEAATLVLRRDREEARPGGAASVAVLAQALGAKVRLFGVVGDDEAGWHLRRLLDEAGVERGGVLHDAARPTTVKQRFAGQAGSGPPQPLLRVDHESRAPLHPVLEKRLVRLLERELDGCGAVLVADHGKGVCTQTLLAEVLAACTRRGVPVLVDPARGADVALYRGAEMLVPNRAEAALACGRRVASAEDALSAARELRRRGDLLGVLVKLDADGMALCCATEPERHLPARARLVRDVTGAGDTVLAMLGLCRACGTAWTPAAELAGVAAALQVGWPGVTPLRRAELREALAPGSNAGRKVVSLERMAELAEGYRRQGRRVVLTNGCFDLLHAGHAACLEEAAGLGDVLVVAVNDDAAVRGLKGAGRPVVGQDDRAALLAALGCVGHVVLFGESTPHEVLRRLRPDVLVKGGDYAPGEVVGAEVVRGYGGRVCVTARRPGLSTSGVLASIRQAAAGA
jgi:D-beta-D-heptose 7-phosphate kinase/D-beta-D-heptose 1-phosphate adenosyltransferase